MSKTLPQLRTELQQAATANSSSPLLLALREVMRAQRESALSSLLSEKDPVLIYRLQAEINASKKLEADLGFTK